MSHRSGSVQITQGLGNPAGSVSDCRGQRIGTIARDSESRSRNTNGAHYFSVIVPYRRTYASQAFFTLFVVHGKAVPPNYVKFLHKDIRGRDRVAGETREIAALEEPINYLLAAKGENCFT